MLSNLIEYSITAIVCVIAAFVIQRIFYKEKVRTSSNIVNGIKWFGLAIFIWGFGALINILLVTVFQLSSSNKIIIYLGVFISLLNSLFILLSIPYIEHQQKRNIVVRLIERFSEKEVFLLFGGVLAMLAFVFIAGSYANEQMANTYIWIIDIPISLVVAFVLLQELNKAFKNRQMRFMYLPSYGLFFLIVIAVTHRIIPEEDVLGYIDLELWDLIGVLTAISFKFLFIMLFMILLYSWKFLSETEQQQTALDVIKEDYQLLQKNAERAALTIDSHLDTIKSLKEELAQTKAQMISLQEASKIILSDRQREVLANLGACGNEKSYTEIADAMHISVDGLQAHIHQIKKLLNVSGASGKEQLINYAITNDLLKYATIDIKK